ncbi:MAG: DUF6152 family protein [Vicinamibacterales bacterium]|nr:DUF6152 family protein [Vicinamibacterales bacterium]
MTRCFCFLVAAGLCLAGPSLHAHHAIGEIYDEERTMVLEGKVASFVLGEPHTIVQVRVEDERGRVHTWALEWRGAAHLQEEGWTDRALNPGDTVHLCGNPGRDSGAYRLYLLNISPVSSGSGPATDAGERLCSSTLRGPAAPSTSSR